MDTEVISPTQASQWSPRDSNSRRNIQEALLQAEKIAANAKEHGSSPHPPPRQLLQYLVRKTVEVCLSDTKLIRNAVVKSIVPYLSFLSTLSMPKWAAVLWDLFPILVCQILKSLLRFIRMGSFTSVPATREDIQDVDFEVSPHDTRESLIHRCVSELPLHALPIRRQFVPLVSSSKFADEITSLRNKNEMDIFGLKRVPLTYEDWAANGLGPKDFTTEGGSFRVLTWNILAQALAVEHDNFVGLPDGTLDWNTRRLHILHEILHYDPDVICLQEVDHYNFISSSLTPLGYRGVFCSKPDSPCIYLANNNGPDGCALFFRRDKFDLISASSRIIEIWRIQSNQVCISANLRLRETGQHVCVATTHLKARQGELLTTMRNEQGKDVSNFLNACGASNKPLVLCGDFNAVPTEPVVSTIKNRLAVKSAYSDLYGGDEPPYTTWKVREDGEYCQTLDYIFYNKFCSVKRVLTLPTEEQVGPTRLPNLNYPSDHIAIACDIHITPAEEVLQPNGNPGDQGL